MCLYSIQNLCVINVRLFVTLCIVSSDTFPHLQPRQYDESKGDQPEGVTEKQGTHKTTLQPQITYVPTVSTPPPVPLGERGEELTFEETGHHKVFMFAQSNTFIQLDGNRIPTFQLR
jgi:hypothetical protein